MHRYLTVVCALSVLILGILTLAFGTHAKRTSYTMQSSSPINVALATNGAVTSASSVHFSGNYPVEAVNNGDRKALNWVSGGGWNDNTQGDYSNNIVQINFPAFNFVSQISDPSPKKTNIDDLAGNSSQARIVRPQRRHVGEASGLHHAHIRPRLSLSPRVALSSSDRSSLYSPNPLLFNPQSGGAQSVIWTNVVGVTASGNSLTKTEATGWGNAGASSTQSFLSGDGYVEVTASETSTARMFGLSDADGDQNWPSIDFGLHLDLSGIIYIFESGNNRGTFGTYASGDKLQVAIVGGVVKYSKNGTVFYTSTVAPSYPLLVDTSLYSNGSTFTNVIISGNLSSNIQNVAWTNVVGVTASGNSLTKTEATGWGNAGAVSTQTITSGDGYVEFTASETSTWRMCGLSRGDSDQNYTDIDFAIYPTGSGSGSVIQVYESGLYRGDFGTYATGDHLRVAVEGGVVKYSKNGAVFYTSTVAPSYPLLVDTSLYSNGSTFTNVIISGNLRSNIQNVAWTNVVGVTASGNSLTKTEATGWGNAGAVSTQTITSGDGYVEFTASETSTWRMCGLSRGDSDQNYTDIDFAVYTTGSGSGSVIQVYESGLYRGDFGTYATGDHLRVAVEGGVVKYSKNGAVFYTSTVAPSYPLLVDTSLYSNGSTLANVIVSVPDDVVWVQPTISISDATVNEGNSGTTSAVFNVTLSSASTQTISINYATANGTASSTSDYIAASGTVTFAPGQTSRPISIQAVGDTVLESNENFFVNLSNPVNATLADSQGVGTILNDDASSTTISISDVSVNEGNSGTTPTMFTVTLSSASTQSISVNYATANGTASSPSDYVGASGTLTFAPGQTSKPITIQVVGDTAGESNENFFVNLSGPVNATLADGQSVCTIRNLSYFEIPVYFHVIRDTNGDGDVAESNLDAQLNVLNSAFNGTTIANVQFFFFKAGVTRDTNHDWFMMQYVNDQQEESAEYEAKRVLHQGGANALNFYTISSVPPEGFPYPIGWGWFAEEYATTPCRDGVVVPFTTLPGVDSNNLNNPFNLGDLPVHEVGHWLGLFHTFGKNCTQSDPDQVDDTPVHLNTNIGQCVEADTCSASPGTDPIHNFMTNTSDLCKSEFTRGQFERMANQYRTFRQSVTMAPQCPIVTVSISDVTVTEGNSGITATFTGTLSSASTQRIDVSFATANGTATSPADYSALSGGTLIFDPEQAQTSQSFSVHVIGDSLVEANENFFVNLSEARNVKIADGQGVGTILNDDFLPVYEGWVDVADCNSIIGWAADRNRLNTSITVSIYDGDNFVTSVPATDPRSDVGAYLGDNGRHGFAILTPEQFKDGLPHTLRVKFESSTTELSASGGTITCATYYEIVARHSGKCLDVEGESMDSGARVIQFGCGGWANQQWQVIPVGGGFYKIVARHSGKVLDVQGGVPDNGTPVWHWDENGTPAQQWEIIDVGGGYVRIMARHSGKALDVAGGFTADGTQVHQWDYVGIANQQWLLRRVP